MEEKHTPGPLKAVRNSAFLEVVTPWHDQTIDEADDNSPSVAYVWGETEEQAEANAKRIAATWNACAGIPTAILETTPPGFFMGGKAIAELAKQRDKLLEVMKHKYEVASEHDEDLPFDGAVYCEMLYQAIAKATSQKV